MWKILQTIDRNWKALLVSALMIVVLDIVASDIYRISFKPSSYDLEGATLGDTVQYGGQSLVITEKDDYKSIGEGLSIILEPKK